MGGGVGGIRSEWTYDSAAGVDSKGVGGKCYSRPDHSTKGLSRTQYRDKKQQQKTKQKNKTKTLKQN